MKHFFSRLKEIGIPYWVIFVLLAVGYTGGLFVPLMDNDSAHHASIALNMFEKGDWAYLSDHDTPYLDKPHFQFWLIAASYWLFGVGGVAYKISSFVFTLLALWATYKLTVHISDKQTGKIAVILLASFAAFALANIDVRMDAILTSAIIIAIWQGILLFDKGKFIHLVLAALGLAIAFGTKGWIGVMVPAFSYLFYLTGTKKLSWLLNWRFPVLILFFFLFISPVLYAYYLQYDLHPELVIRGKDHISGIKFILWDQVFERMDGGLGTSSANDPFFFLHTLLWAVLPWSLLFYLFLFTEIKSIIKTKKVSASFWFTIPAILLTMAALSVSKFKLPHYLNVLFPLMAVFMADKLQQISNYKFLQGIGVMQKLIVSVILVAVILLNFIAFPIYNNVLMIVTVAGILCIIYLLFYKTASVNNIVKTGALASALLWITLNFNFYPQLLTYQAGNEMAATVRKKNIDTSQIGMYDIGDNSYSFDIYTARVLPFWTWETIQSRIDSGETSYLFVEQSGFDKLKEKAVPFEVIDKKRDYRITRLNMKFLNPSTRDSLLTVVYLVKI